MNDKVRIGGLWAGKTRDGKTYYSGKVNGNLKMLVFEVDKKDKDGNVNEKRPDLEVFFAAVEREEGAEGGTAGDGTATVGTFGKGKAKAADEFPDE